MTNPVRILAGTLALALPMLGFASPPMGPPDGAGPAGADFHGPMGPGDERGFGRHERGGWHGHGGGFGGERMLAGLKLSEDQEDKVFTIMHTNAPAVREQMKALRKAHESLRGFATSDKFDDARARSLVDAVTKAESQLMLLHIRAEHSIYAVLTPEQRAKLEERKHRWQERGQREHDGHDGPHGDGAHDGAPMPKG